MRSRKQRSILEPESPGRGSKLSLVGDPYDEDVRRLAELIGSAVELSGQSLASLEQPTGLSADALHKIFSGATKLEVAHVLRLADALGIHPADFFYLVYRRGRSQAGGRELLERLRPPSSLSED